MARSNTRKGTDEGVKLGNPREVKSIQFADKIGISTAATGKAFLRLLIADIMTRRISPLVANSARSSLNLMAKLTEMEHRYGVLVENQKGKGEKVLFLTS